MKITKRNTQEKIYRYGFTLIEILVVLAIIVILAAILFPVFARARENARRASCMSNLKQIAFGILQYTQDYDERYPLAYDGTFTPQVFHTQTVPGMPGTIYTTVGTAGAISWMDMIFPYVKSIQVFQCPSQPLPNMPYDSKHYSRYHAASYGYNGAFNGYDADHYGRGGGNRNIAITLASVHRPSEVALVVDFLSSYNSENQAYNFVKFKEGDNTDISPHFQGTNIAYADGHVKWMKTRELVGPYVESGNWHSYDSPDSLCMYANPIWNPFLN